MNISIIILQAQGETGILILSTIYAFLEAHNLLHKFPSAEPPRATECPSWRAPLSEEGMAKTSELCIKDASNELRRPTAPSVGGLSEQGPPQGLYHSTFVPPQPPASNQHTTQHVNPAITDYYSSTQHAGAGFQPARQPSDSPAMRHPDYQQTRTPSTAQTSFQAGLSPYAQRSPSPVPVTTSGYPPLSGVYPVRHPVSIHASGTKPASSHMDGSEFPLDIDPNEFINF